MSNRQLFIFILLSLNPIYSAVIAFSSTNITSGDIFRVFIKKETKDVYLRVYQNGVRRLIYRRKDQPNWYHFFAGYDIENTVNRVTIKVISKQGVFKKTLPIKLLPKKAKPQGKVDIKSSSKKMILAQDPAKFSQENYFFHQFFSKETREQYWKKNWLVPLAKGKVSSTYGKLRRYNNGRVSFHRGVDFVAPIGTPVRAANNGVVVYSGKKTVRGHIIIIDHGMGVFTTYWHLNKREVEAGKRVKKGEIIGAMGQTGLATGPHLHWGVRILNTPVNGLKLLKMK